MTKKKEVEKSWDDRAAEIGSCALRSILEMVAALECDYDRLEELRDDRDGWDGPGSWDGANPDESEELKELEDAAGDCESREDADTRIQEDPLSIQFRSGWVSNKDEMEAEEFEILLTTGGPAVRIIGEIRNGQPCRPRLEVQDWFKPWTEYLTTGVDNDALETYCQQFYFE
jgi:hypothetical protein